MKFMKFFQILDFQKKSHIKAGDGLNEGSFPFFTSSPILSKYSDSFQFDLPSLIFGTGGSASVHICEKPFAVSTDCLVAQLKHSVIRKFEIKFVYYYLFGNIWILEEGFRGAGLRHISKGYINNIDIPELSFEDQKRIVKILDEADTLRQKRKQAIGYLDDYLKSAFLEMFGDPVKNPKGWKVKSIKELGVIKTGTTPPSSKEGMFDGGCIPFITPGDLENKYTKRFITEPGLSNSRSARKGATMVCCIGATIGKIGTAQELSGFNQQINSIEWHQNLIKDLFGYFSMKFMKSTIISRGISTTLPILKKSEFEKIKIPVPTIDIQEKFEIISLKQESLRQKMLTQSEELENQYQALMQKAFKGEL